jgi:hypothetical protein
MRFPIFLMVEIVAVVSSESVFGSLSVRILCKSLRIKCCTESLPNNRELKASYRDH